MSETEDFEVLDKLNDKYFTELETSVPHVQQTLFDLQNNATSHGETQLLQILHYAKNF